MNLAEVDAARLRIGDRPITAAEYHAMPRAGDGFADLSGSGWCDALARSPRYAISRPPQTVTWPMARGSLLNAMLACDLEMGAEAMAEMRRLAGADWAERVKAEGDVMTAISSHLLCEPSTDWLPESPAVRVARALLARPRIAEVGHRWLVASGDVEVYGRILEDVMLERADGGLVAVQIKYTERTLAQWSRSGWSPVSAAVYEMGLESLCGESVERWWLVVAAPSMTAVEPDPARVLRDVEIMCRPVRSLPRAAERIDRARADVLALAERMSRGETWGAFEDVD